MHSSRSLPALLVVAALAACTSDPAGPDDRDRLTSSLSAGAFHTCQVTSEGVVFCWGENRAGQLGLGFVSVGGEVTPVVGKATFASIDGGTQHTCGVTTAADAMCWGGNSTGALGIDSRQSQAQPAMVVGEQVFLQVSAGGAHTCGLTTDGAAYCWGSNTTGQLGEREVTTTCGNTPCATVATRVSGALVFRSLTTGTVHSCGLTRDGVVYCWGQNGIGQLGNETFISSATPVLVQTDERFVALEAGNAHTCGITDDGRVLCWGSNGRGQIGATTLQCGGGCANRPVQLASQIRFRRLAAGGSHTCAIGVDQTAHCWGANRSGELGNGGFLDEDRAQRVAGGLAFREITAGANHTCGITTDDRTFCWGDNLRFQLGNGGVGVRQTEPVPVIFPEGAP